MVTKTRVERLCLAMTGQKIYKFCGYKFGKFTTDNGELVPFCNIFVISKIEGTESADYRFGGYQADKFRCVSPDVLHEFDIRACLKNRSVTVDVGFFVGMKAIFRRNTLCISRKIDKMTAEKTRRRVRYRFFKQALSLRTMLSCTSISMAV